MRQTAKRVLDICLAFLGLVFLSPLLAILALVARSCLGSPVIFQTTRPGLRGRPFVLYKFRSMTDTVDASGVSRPDAERLVPFGRFMRRTSLDELPELWNVLKGDMSMVGPRPLLPGYLPLYSAEQARRHEVRPGLTGWAQVNGRNALTWEERFKLDVWYVDHASFWLDIKILLMTMGSVVSGSGISAAGHATMPPFSGSVTRQKEDAHAEKD